VIGVDLDNTLVEYDVVARTLASELGLPVPSDEATAKEIRDALRLGPSGDLAWQQLQARMYGDGMATANMAAGAAGFLSRCKRAGARVVIVSHKTRYAHQGARKVDLRIAALDWLHGNGFFDQNGFGLQTSDVHFADTRAVKIETIRNLGCGSFVDDLVEVLEDPSFPEATVRVLYDPSGRSQASAGTNVFRTWSQISEFLLAE